MRQRICGCVLHTFCAIWQDCEVICKTSLVFVDPRPQDICLCKLIQGAVRRVSSWRQGFSFAVSPSRMTPILRRLFAKRVQARLWCPDFVIRSEDTNDILNLTARRRFDAERRRCDGGVKTEDAADARLAEIVEAVHLDAGDDDLADTDGSGAGKEKDVAVEDCGICLLAFDDPAAWPRVQRPCCPQPICSKCDGLCHSRGEPCAFCRQVVAPAIASDEEARGSITEASSTARARRRRRGRC